MKKVLSLVAASCILAAPALKPAVAAERAPFAFKDGDSVVFLGDSITQQQLYTNYIETYLLTRFPTWKLQFRNAGWGGDTSYLRTRGVPPIQALQRDVIDLKPTVVTIDFGMNDFGYGEFKQSLYDAHVAGETAIVQQLKAARIRPVVLTPSPIEKNAQGDNFQGLNENLGLYAAADAAIAARENVPFADQFTPYVEAINRLRTIAPDLRLTLHDEVHPQQPGHLMMASFILSGLNAPSTVSVAALNAGSGSVTTATGTKISDVVRSNGGIAFRRLDQALVFPVDASARPALQITPVADLINRYMLYVSDLDPGAYTISINGAQVARASADELSHGVNLGYYDGPHMAAGHAIMDHVNKKNALYYRLWREVQLGGGPESDKKNQTADLTQQIANEERQINDLRKPKAFTFEIKKWVLPVAKPVTPKTP